MTVHIKNGWLPYPGDDDWRINSIGAFTGKGITYQIAILTGPPDGDGQGESYGITTIQAAAAVINRNLAGTSASTVAPPSGSVARRAGRVIGQTEPSRPIMRRDPSVPDWACRSD